MLKPSLAAVLAMLICQPAWAQSDAATQGAPDATVAPIPPDAPVAPLAPIAPVPPDAAVAPAPPDAQTDATPPDSQVALLPPLPLSASATKTGTSTDDCKMTIGPGKTVSMWMTPADCQSWTQQAQSMATGAAADTTFPGEPPPPADSGANPIAGNPASAADNPAATDPNAAPNVLVSPAPAPALPGTQSTLGAATPPESAPQCYADYLTALGQSQSAMSQAAEGNPNNLTGTSLQTYKGQVYSQYSECLRKADGD